MGGVKVMRCIAEKGLMQLPRPVQLPVHCLHRHEAHRRPSRTFLELGNQQQGVLPLEVDAVVPICGQFAREFGEDRQVAAIFEVKTAGLSPRQPSWSAPSRPLAAQE